MIFPVHYKEGQPFNISFDDIVGVERHPKKPKCLVIYCFQLHESLRERFLYKFHTKEEETVSKWIESCTSVIQGYPIGGTPFFFQHLKIIKLIKLVKIPPFNALVIINPAGGKSKGREMWNDIKDIFSISCINTRVSGKSFFVHFFFLKN